MMTESQMVIHQTHQEMEARDFWKVVLSSSLLFLITFTSMVFNWFESIPDEWMYRHYNYVCDCFEWNTLTPWKEPVRWFVMRVSNRTSLVILCLVWLINPYTDKWGQAVKVMWIVYFLLLVYSFESSYNTIPFRIHLETSVMIIQDLYTFYCGYLWNTRR